MPVMSGYDVARHLRSEPWGKQVTLVAVTGWGQEEDKQRTQAAGFDVHMVKPVSPRDLVQFLTRLQPVGH